MPVLRVQWHFRNPEIIKKFKDLETLKNTNSSKEKVLKSTTNMAFYQNLVKMSEVNVLLKAKRSFLSVKSGLD